MRTISQVVEEILEASPLILEAMEEGIANNAHIARRIQPAVEKRLYEKVSTAAIAMAVHRFKKQAKAPRFGTKFLKHMHDITVRSSLIEYALLTSVETSQVLEKISRLVQKHRDTFFNFSRGLHETVLIAHTDCEVEIDEVLRGKVKAQKAEGLSAITMRLPEGSLNVPGVYYPILKAIAAEGISFVEVISVRTELSIIFFDKDIDRAFAVLKRITS